MLLCNPSFFGSSLVPIHNFIQKRWSMGPSNSNKNNTPIHTCPKVKMEVEHHLMSKNGKSPDLRWSPYARVCPLIYIRSSHQWHPWWPQAPTFSASIAAKNSTAARLDESTTASRFHGSVSVGRFLKICFFSNCEPGLRGTQIEYSKKYSKDIKRCPHQQYCEDVKVFLV